LPGQLSTHMVDIATVYQSGGFLQAFFSISIS
jgi:hypothetical protein